MQALEPPQLLGPRARPVIESGFIREGGGLGERLQDFIARTFRGRTRDARKPNQVLERTRLRLCDLMERLVRQYPAARQVAFHRAFLAPARERADRALRGR